MEDLAVLIDVLPILLLIIAGIVLFSLINATLNTLYYFIRDKHWSWKWWLEIFKYGLSFLRILIPTGSSRSSSSRSSSRKNKGFGGGSSRGGGSGRSF